MLCLREKVGLTTRFLLHTEAALKILRAAMLKYSRLPIRPFGKIHFPAPHARCEISRERYPVDRERSDQGQEVFRQLKKEIWAGKIMGKSNRLSV